MSIWTVMGTVFAVFYAAYIVAMVVHIVRGFREAMAERRAPLPSTKVNRRTMAFRTKRWIVASPARPPRTYNLTTDRFEPPR